MYNLRTRSKGAFAGTVPPHRMSVHARLPPPSQITVSQAMDLIVDEIAEVPETEIIASSSVFGNVINDKEANTREYTESEFSSD